MIIDGKRGVILGITGKGKSLFALTLLDYCKKLSFYISPKNPEYVFKDLRVYRSLKDFCRERTRGLKYHFSFLYMNEYERLYQYLYEVGQNINIFIDEASLWLDQWKVNESIRNLVLLGRSKNISVILITQRAQFCNPTIIGQTDFRVYFNMTDPNDLKKVNNRELIAIIPELQPFEFMVEGDLNALKNL